MVSWIVVIAILAVLLPMLPNLLYPTDIASFSVDDIPELSNNMIIVVTGANTGLGLGVVQHLVQASTAKLVMMVCRNMEKCQAARSSVMKEFPSSTTRLVTILMDLSNPQSIASGAIEIQRQAAEVIASDRTTQPAMNPPPIHVLINNAGVMGAWKSREFVNNVETHLYVNHVGHALLTHYLFPNLLQGHGRIVSVSSVFSLAPADAAKNWFQQDYDSRDAKKRASLQTDRPNMWDALYGLYDALRYYAKSKRSNLQFCSGVASSVSSSYL